MIKESKITKITNIYELIALIKERPGLYIGEPNITALNSFINGYIFSNLLHNIEEERVYPPFWYFNEWSRHKYNWNESTSGWKNIILTENDKNEEHALNDFFNLFDDFKTLQPTKIQELIITDSNLDFHKSDNCKWSDGQGNPIFDSLDRILLVTYSHKFGLSYFTIKNNQINSSSWKELFSTENKAKNRIKELFGSELRWKTLKSSYKNLLLYYIKNSSNLLVY